MLALKKVKENYVAICKQVNYKWFKLNKHKIFISIFRYFLNNLNKKFLLLKNNCQVGIRLILFLYQIRYKWSFFKSSRYKTKFFALTSSRLYAWLFKCKLTLHLQTLDLPNSNYWYFVHHVKKIISLLKNKYKNR